MNKTLGEIRSMRRGADNIRRYNIENLDTPYLEIKREVEGIENERDILEQGGSSHIYTYDDLPQSLLELYKKNERLRTEEKKSLQDQKRVARTGRLNSAYTNEHLISEIEKDQKLLRRNSNHSQSIAESSKVTNEGILLLLETNKHNTMLQNQQLDVLSTMLMREVEKDEEKRLSENIDDLIIINARRKK
ncbi:MAG: hypothetical protein KDK51_06770 [Deltaproteobacteria bacterium]|nr:hypothetical protein [Deltaproteobacteria bacterium]